MHDSNSYYYTKKGLYNTLRLYLEQDLKVPSHKLVSSFHFVQVCQLSRAIVQIYYIVTFLDLRLQIRDLITI